MNPTKATIVEFMKLVNEFAEKKLAEEPHSPSTSGSQLSEERVVAHSKIAIHCLAGLGRYVTHISLNHHFRAPTMVAIALMEHGATPEEAVKLIRKERPGAFNFIQTNFVLNYKPLGMSSSPRKKTGGTSGTKSCCITF